MERKEIKTRELRRGDIVELSWPGWNRAKVIQESDSMVTLFRPWMKAGDDGYPSIGVEIFQIFKDSDTPITLVDREEEER